MLLILKKIKDDGLAKTSTLVVSHSQGNLFANEVSNGLKVTLPDKIKYYANLQIGSAAASISAENGDYITAKQDNIIFGLLRNVLGFSILSPNMELYNYLDTNVGQYHSFNGIYTSDTILGALDGTFGVKPMGEHFTDKAIELIDKIIPEPPIAKITAENWIPGNLKSGTINLKVEFNEQATDYSLYRYKNGVATQLAKLDFASAVFTSDEDFHSQTINISYSQVEGERLELFITKNLDKREDIDNVSWQIPYLERFDAQFDGNNYLVIDNENSSTNPFRLRFEGSYSFFAEDYTLTQSDAYSYGDRFIGCYPMENYNGERYSLVISNYTTSYTTGGNCSFQVTTNIFANYYLNGANIKQRRMLLRKYIQPFEE